MKDLYEVMNQLLKVEDELNAFNNISTVLYNGCCSNSENIQLKSMLCLTVKYIDTLSTDLRHSINDLDEFIAHNPACKINPTTT